MSDTALDNALARLAFHQAELAQTSEDMEQLMQRRARIEGDLAKLRAFVDTWYEIAGIQRPEEPEQTEFKPVPEPRRSRPRNPDRKAVAARCVDYIRDAGQPLKRSELFQRLADEGMTIQGKDPEMVLSTMLWRTKDVIRRLKGGGYWPVGDPLPPQYSDDFEDLIG